MDMTEFLVKACERLAEAWKVFGVSLQKAIQAFFEEKEKSKKSKITPIKYHKKDYLHNQNISTYRVNRKIQRNLPYQRRNY